MKKIILFLLGICMMTNLLAQAPQGIPYQSIIRNGNGNLLVNQSVQVRFTIHDSTMSGNIVYQETHTTTTSATAMLILTIGQGTPATGTFTAIIWGNGAKFMQVELDANGGNNYVDLGTQQMMSVPYALYAGNGLKNGTASGEMMYWNGTAWMNVAPGTEGQSLSFHNGIPTWESRLSVGMEYQGGIIAYILHQGDTGYDSNVVHGLIAAPSDQGITEWGCYATTISGADGTNLGTGNQNTIDIMNGCSTASIAARICSDLVLNGYSDWYLPSLEELNKLYWNKSLIGALEEYYWSSTEGYESYWSNSNYSAWRQIFANNSSGGLQNKVNKSSTAYVRAVRSF